MVAEVPQDPPWAGRCTGDHAMEEWRQVRATFEEALELGADERVAFVERQLASSPKALKRALRLLRFHVADGPALEPPQGVWRPSLETPPTPGDSLAGYSLLGVLGEGGMGIVYEAEQAAPHRRVALKVLRPMPASTDGKREEKSRLFLNESNVLGALTHPQIAQIYDAGTADDLLGRETHYFAMELVDGARDIVRYAEEEGLSVEARIAMLRDVCAGVAYGHGKGVVHRDLKPANVLVDQAGRLKVIDFGIARVADEDALLTVFTDDNQRVVGTLAYMAPEQLAGNTGADPRIDVYALGVLAFELFTGRRPFQANDELQGQTVTAHVGEVQRILKAGRPPSASQFRPGLPKDLDWVIDRALEADPERRYADAAALGAELDALLHNRPVEAGPPSRLYAAKRFVQRHRALVLVNALLVASLIAGLAGALVWRQQEATQVEALLQELRRTGTVIELWDRTFIELSLQLQESGDDNQGLRKALTVSRRSWKGGTRPADAKVLGLVMLARAQEEIGHVEGALKTIQFAVQIGEKNLGETHREVQIARVFLAKLLYLSDQKEAALVQVETLLGQERADLLVADAFTLSTAEDFGRLLGSLGRLEDLEDTFRWVAGQVARLSPDHPMRTVAATHRLAKEVFAWGDAERAVEVIDTEVASAYSAAGKVGLPGTAMMTRAWALSTLGRRGEAIAQVEAALHQLTDGREPTAGRLSVFEAEFGWLLVHDEQLGRAEEMFRRVIERPLNIDSEPHGLERLEALQLKRAQELPYAPRKGRERMEPIPVGAKIGLALCLVLRSEFDEARLVLEAAQHTAMKLFPLHHPDRAVLHGTLGRLAALDGDAAKAKAEYGLAEEVLQRRTDRDFYQFQTIERWSQELTSLMEQSEETK